MKRFIRDKVFKNGPNKICGRQPLKIFIWSILEYFVTYVPLHWGAILTHQCILRKTTEWLFLNLDSNEYGRSL